MHTQSHKQSQRKQLVQAYWDDIKNNLPTAIWLSTLFSDGILDLLDPQRQFQCHSVSVRVVFHSGK